MDVKYAPYELKSRGGKVRTGALLKVGEGYADLHPWPELGDLPLAEQLASLRQSKSTPLTRNALEFARADAAARSRQVSLFQDLPPPPLSHALWNGDVAELSKLADEGFEILKVKISPANVASLKVLKDFPQFRIRLDANNSFAGASDFLNVLAQFSGNLQFVEDPFTFSIPEWRKVSEDKVALALDRKVELAPQAVVEMPLPDVTLPPVPFEYLILKPAVDNVPAWIEVAHQNILRVVVTTYLGHPLGSVQSAWVAARLCQEHPLLVDEGGLLSHRHYETTAYSAQLANAGPAWKNPEGIGAGFAELLAREKWLSL